ncbi:MAG: hypothetical protein HYX20_03320 [Candidatus Yanofskybacteria bacterium]|nr:hypothetical protein [Candidatus Yanofskybacteria bacterium]
MIKIPSKVVFWALVLVGSLGLMIFSSVSRNAGPSVKNPSPSTLVIVSPTVFPAISPAITPKVTKTALPTPTASDAGELFKGIPDQGLVPTSVPKEQITGSATCRLEGGINFIREDLYESKGAKIVYHNVDSPARLIFWKVTPDDGVLKIGPNIFSGLPLPGGEREIGVTIEKTASAKSYTLAATITYGENDEREVEKIKEASCFGIITVTMP